MGYFITILTQNANEIIAVSVHNQKLNNYLNYGAITTDELVVKNNYPKLSKKKDVESHSLSTTMKNNNFVLTSILCCEDEEREVY